ncbi:pp2a multicopy suppressor, partial [Perkinsus olseni]
TVEFMPSPKMSSYLVAFCVGQFEFVQDTTKKGTLVRVLCTPGKQAQCGYALEVATRVLAWYEEFFGIPYPLPKLDLIAVPDFAMGAMENWGLVTYREIDLLCNPDK